MYEAHCMITQMCYWCSEAHGYASIIATQPGLNFLTLEA